MVIAAAPNPPAMVHLANRTRPPDPRVRVRSQWWCAPATASSDGCRYFLVGRPSRRRLPPPPRRITSPSETRYDQRWIRGQACDLVVGIPRLTARSSMVQESLIWWRVLVRLSKSRSPPVVCLVTTDGWQVGHLGGQLMEVIVEHARTRDTATGVGAHRPGGSAERAIGYQQVSQCQLPHDDSQGIRTSLPSGLIRRADRSVNQSHS